MKPSLKRGLLISVAGVLLIVLSGLTAAGIYLNSSGFKDRLLTYANAQLDGRLVFSGHHISPFSGRLRLNGLELFGPDGDLLMSVQYAQAELSYSALLARIIRLDRITIDRGYLNLVFDARDRLKLVRVTSGQAPTDQIEGSSSWQLVVAELQVGDTAIDYHRPVRGWSGQAAGIDLTARLDLTRNAGQAAFSVKQVTWRDPQREGRLDELKLKAAYRPDADDPAQLSVTTPHGRFDFTGRIEPDSAQPRLQGSLGFDLELSALQEWLPLPVAFGGRATGDLVLNGDLYNPEAELTFSIARPRMDEIALDRLAGRVALHDRQVTISTLNSQAPWGRAEADGSIDLRPLFQSDFRNAADGAPSYQINLTAEQLQPGRIPVLQWPFDGIYNLDAQVRGQGWEIDKHRGQARISATARQFKAVKSGQTLDGSLSTRLQWTGQRLSVEEGRIVMGPNRADLEGRIDYDQQQVQGRADLVLDNLAALEPHFGVALPVGRATLSLSVSGDLRRPAASGHIDGHDLDYAGWRAKALAADLAWTPGGRLSVTQLRIQNQEARLTGTVSIDLLGPDGQTLDQPPVSATLKLQNIPPADVGLPSDLTGALNGTLSVGNTLPDPFARLELARSSLNWQKLGFDARGTARWEAGRLVIDKLLLGRAQSQVRIAGSVDWYDDGSGWTGQPDIDLQLETSRLRLQDLSDDYAGTFTAQVELAGRPAGLKGVYDLSGKSIDLGFQKLSGFSARGSLDNSRIDVRQLSVSLAPGQILQAHGWYGFDHRFELSAESEGIDLQAIDALKTTGPLQGRLRLHVAGDGTLEQPRIQAQADIVAPQYDTQRFDDFHLDAILNGRRLELNADLNFAMTAQIDLTNGDFSLESHFERTDLTPYLSLAAGQAWAGRLSGDLNLSGNHRSLHTLDGRLELTELEVVYREAALLSAQALIIGLRNGVLDMPRARIQLLESGFLELEASGDWQHELEAQLQGRLPVAALAIFSESLGDAAGQVVLQAQASGALDALRWKADLQFEQVSFVIPELLQSVQALNGRIRLGIDELSVEALAGRIGTGRFSLNGRVGLKDWQPVEGRLKLQAQALPLYWPDTADFLVNGDLELTGNVRQALLAGTVVLLEGIYYKDFRLNLLSVISQDRRAPSPSLPVEKPKWMTRIALDVDLTHRYPLLVDNNIARLTIAPDFKIGGTLAEPLISGRAQVVEGEIIYRRKSFTVTRGVVDFINPYRNEPIVDVAAQTTIGQYNISLAVSGKPEQLAFTMNSDPPLADSDILSLVLIGRTTRELSPGEGGGPSTRQMLSSLIATAWGEDIKQRTGVDILEVETGGQAGDAVTPQDRVQVTVGKHLSRRLTVKYEVETAAGERVQRAVSEYQFMENLLAKGFQDSQGQYGGEVLFRLEFR